MTLRHRTTKIKQGLAILDCNARLRNLGIYTLQGRRIREDINLFRYIKQGDVDNLDFGDDKRTMGNGLTLYKTSI